MHEQVYFIYYLLTCLLYLCTRCRQFILRIWHSATTSKARNRMDPQKWHKIAAISGNSILSSICYLPVVQNLLSLTSMAYWNRNSCTCFGHIRCPWLQAKRSFLQRSMRLYPWHPILLHQQGLILILFMKLGIIEQVWQTASLYHLVHTAALVAAPITKHPNVVSFKLSFCFLIFTTRVYQLGATKFLFFFLI